MYPSLPSGSTVFAFKRAYSDASSVKRGDIIVFTREQDGRRYNYIWRVVGLPGEKVETFDESLKINGQDVSRQYIREADGRNIFREHIGNASYEIAFDVSSKSGPPTVSLVVPAGCFFVMGDNRSDAHDSRYFGPVAFGSIIGKKL